ncbi:reverse transcriptase domain-containing protein, partial [Tanacetum coccineum]
ACPTCNEDTPFVRVLGKTAYVCHRRFLKKPHKWRRSLEFNGEIENGDTPRKFDRDQIQAQLARLPTRVKGKHPSYGGVKIKRNVLVELNWTKRSIFYELEYWSFLTLKHNLDIMHIEKNVLEAILNTLLMNDKSKDTAKARRGNLKIVGSFKLSSFRELKRKIKKRTKPEKTLNVPLEIESPVTHVKQPFIEELFVVTSKIKILMEKFETPPDSPPLIVIDPDDQSMWSSTRTVAPTPSFAIIQRLISTNFRIKGTHMQMIRDNQFDGQIWSDPHRHVADFLEISNIFQYGENQEEAVILRTFPFSLSGESKTWLNELDERIITSWNEMRESFISRYFSPAKFKRLLNDIHSFHQLGNETLVEAWLCLKEILRACYGHGLTKGMIIHIFYRGLDGPAQGILNTGGIFLYNTPNEAFKILKDKVPFQLEFSGESQNSPKPKTVVSAGGNNINPDLAKIVDKFKALATKIDSEFLIIRKELKEIQDGLSLAYQNPSPSINTKPRHEIIYKIPSIRNDNDKGDIKFIEEEETEPNPTMPNPNLIMSNSPTVSPFLKDCTLHIPYTQEKVFEHDEISNHVGNKELISFVGIGNEVSKGNIDDTENPERPNVSPLLVEYIPKIPYPQAFEKENFPFEPYHQRILNLGKSLANDSEIN